MSSFALAKITARQRVHDSAGVALTYSDGVEEARPNADDLAAGLVLTARWHNKNVVQQAAAQEAAVILENVDRLIFNQPQLNALGLVLVRLGVVTFPEYEMSFELDQPEDSDGPLNVYWAVSRIV